MHRGLLKNSVVWVWLLYYYTCASYLVYCSFYYHAWLVWRSKILNKRWTAIMNDVKALQIVVNCLFYVTLILVSQTDKSFLSNIFKHRYTNKGLETHHVIPYLRAKSLISAAFRCLCICLWVYFNVLAFLKGHSSIATQLHCCLHSISH